MIVSAATCGGISGLFMHLVRNHGRQTGLNCEGKVIDTHDLRRGVFGLWQF